MLSQDVMRTYIVGIMVILVDPIKSNIITGWMLVVQEEIGDVAWVLFHVLKKPCKVYRMQLVLNLRLDESRIHSVE